MLDINMLRKQLPEVIARLKTRPFDFPEKEFNALENERKEVQTKTEELQALRNQLSKQIGIAKSKGEDAAQFMAEAAAIPEKLNALSAQLDSVRERLNELLMSIPNLPHESVPVGRDEHDNVEQYRWGTPRTFDFPVKDHVDVGAPLGLDFDTAAKLSGSRFCYMKGQVAKLHRALAQFMLDMHTTEHGYTSGDLSAYLFGSIVTVTHGDVAALTALTLFIIAGALLWLRPVMYVAFDRDFARSRGIPTRVISYVMAALIAVTIVLSIRIMGIVLLISLLTMPVAIVNSLSRSYRTIALCAPLVAVAGNVAGLVASYNFEVPPGAAIIFTLTLTLIVVKLLPLRNKKAGAAA